MARRLTVGDLVVDRDARQVARGSEVLEVKGLTFDLLDALIEAAGEPVSLQALVNTVWRGEAVSNEAITQRVRLLRRALTDDPNKPRYIETRRNTGYRICARMIELADRNAPDTRPRRRGAHWLVVAVLGAVFAAGLLARSGVPIRSDPLLERARAYAATGQGDDNRRAIDLFEQKLAASPEHYGATLGLSFALAQRSCRHDGGPSFAARAKTLAGELVARRAADREARLALAYADDCLGLIERALDGYLAVWREDDTQLAARASAAHLLQIKGQLAQALGHNLAVEEQTRQQPFRYVDMQIARCLELMGFKRAAEARLARTVQLYPDNLFAAVAYARFLMTDGRPDQALTATKRADELGASTAALRSLQAELALAQGDRVAARRFANAALAAAPEDAWAQTLADVLAPSPGESVDAARMTARVDTIRDSIGAGDLWPKQQLNAALLLWHLGRHGEAFGALEAAVTQGFRDPDYLASSPLFAPMVATPLGGEAVRRMRAAAARERDAALAAPWWRASLIDPDAL